MVGWNLMRGIYVTEATKVEQFQEETENDIKCSWEPVREELQKVSIGFSKIDGLVSCDFGHRSFRKVETAEGWVQWLEKWMEGKSWKSEYNTI